MPLRQLGGAQAAKRQGVRQTMPDLKTSSRTSCGATADMWRRLWGPSRVAFILGLLVSCE